jgi:hypothetical protein
MNAGENTVGCLGSGEFVHPNRLFHVFQALIDPIRHLGQLGYRSARPLSSGIAYTWNLGIRRRQRSYRYRAEKPIQHRVRVPGDPPGVAIG